MAISSPLVLSPLHFLTAETSSNMNLYSTMTLFYVLLAMFLAPTSTQPTDEQLDHNLEKGNAALSTGDFPTAIAHYQSCLNLDPDHRYCLINYASALVDSLDPEDPNETTKQEHTTQAIEMLRRVLKTHPHDGDAAFNLAILLQDTSRSQSTTQEAALLYIISVKASEEESGEERWDAWANLASAQQELGVYLGPYGAHSSYERSIVYLEKMTQSHQSYIDTMLHSPNSDKIEWNEEEYEQVSAELWHMNHLLSKLYYGLGSILSELSPGDCRQLMNQETLLINALDGQDDEDQAKEICMENAVNALRMAVDLDGENMVAAHMLNALVGEEGMEGGSTRASNEFVEG